MLGLRYSIEVKGSKLIDDQTKMLFLPNHQAVVDPQIIVSYLMQHKIVSPMVGEKYYKMALLNPLFRLLKAVPVSDLEAGTRDTNVLKYIISAAQTALSNGHSVLLYPSGQLCGQGYERIFNKQAAFELVGLLNEDTKIIGVRITGLWGSMWSKAWEGKTPPFIKTYLKALWYCVANLFIFIPKRKIKLEFTDITNEVKRSAINNRKEFNDFLETYYNALGEEEVLFLKHYFYAKKLNRSLPKNIRGAEIRSSITK